MKNILRYFLLGFMLLALNGCGGGGGSEPASCVKNPNQPSCQDYPDSYTCNAACASYVNAAKNSIFGSSLSRSDYDSAVADIRSAERLAPDNPDVNLLSALLDIVEEADRITSTVLYTPSELFPLATEYESSKETLGRITMPLTAGVFRSLPRTPGKFTSDHPDSAEFQAEIQARLIPVMEGVIAKLNRTRTFSRLIKNWSFSYPKSTHAYLGDDYIDENDVDILAGAMRLALGVLYYYISYEFEPPAYSDPCSASCTYYSSAMGDLLCVMLDQGEIRTNYAAQPNFCPEADTNSDGILTPEEYFPPSPFATTRSDGATYLSKAAINFSSGISLLDTAVNNILAEAEPELAGMNLTFSLISDANYFKHYLSEVKSSMAGTTTTITVPEIMDCWTHTYYPKTYFDPVYSADKIDNCSLLVTVTRKISISVNLKALFSVTDLRDINPSYTLTQQDSKYRIATSDFEGNTIGGIFPGGILKEWFDKKTLVYANLELYDSTTGNALTDTDGATLTIGGKSLYRYENSQSTRRPYYAQFRSRPDPSVMPTADQYVTVNRMFGTQALLTVPGYQDATIYFNGTGYWGNVYLTPQ